MLCKNFRINIKLDNKNGTKFSYKIFESDHSKVVLVNLRINLLAKYLKDAKIGTKIMVTPAGLSIRTTLTSGTYTVSEVRSVKKLISVGVLAEIF